MAVVGVVDAGLRLCHRPNCQIGVERCLSGVDLREWGVSSGERGWEDVGGVEVTELLVVAVVGGGVVEGEEGEKNFAVVGGGAWCLRQYSRAKACLRLFDHGSLFFFFFFLPLALALLKMGKGGRAELSASVVGVLRGRKVLV